MSETQDREAIIQNLEDAGCSAETIQLFLSYEENGKVNESLALLGRHRACLLDSVHLEQEKLDCLDYLIHRIRCKGVVKE